MSDAIAVIAREALDGFDRGTTRTAPSARGRFEISDAYRAAAYADAALLSRGWRHVGRKLAFTDRSTWPKLGLDRPAWGYVYDRSVHALADTEGSFALGRTVAPRIETEIVVGLRRAPSAAATTADVAACLAFAALGFEIIDCHYPGWQFTPADALADLVFHAALLVGERREFRSEAEGVAWAAAMPDAAVTVRRGGVAPVSGSPRAVLGDPLSAVAALPTLIAGSGAEPLRAGELVSTGTMTTPFDIHAGDTVDAEISGLGLAPLRVRFR